MSPRQESVNARICDYSRSFIKKKCQPWFSEFHVNFDRAGFDPCAKTSGKYLFNFQAQRKPLPILVGKGYQEEGDAESKTLVMVSREQYYCTLNLSVIKSPIFFHPNLLKH